MKFKMTIIKLVILWIILNILTTGLMDLAMFAQTTSTMKDSTFLKKAGVAEFWATLEWMLLIPANRLGNRFLTAAQISLSSFVFDFLGQVATNKFYLKIVTTPDDYVAMVIIMAGMAISTYKLCG